MFTVRILTLTCLLVVMSSVSFSATPNSIAYQGRATDIGGAPLNGVQMMSFTILDAPAAGLSLWASGVMGVTCTEGLFTVELGASPMPVLPSNIFDDTVRYLAVTVNGQTITPRAHLISVPFARNVARLEGAAGGAVNGNVDLQTSGSTRIDLETSGSRISTYNSTGAERVRLWGPSWGEMILYQTTAGSEIAAVKIDALTSSLSLNDVVGTPKILLSGTGSGDGSAVLLQNAINSVEMLNEPGLAANHDVSAILGGAPSNISLRTITVPDDGYVIAMASSTCQLVHINLTFSQVSFGLSETSATLDPNTVVSFVVSGNAPSGTYGAPVNVTAVYPVTSGAHTFYFTGDLAGGASSSTGNSRLVLFYVPTSYGTVATVAPQQPIDPAQERVEAAEFNSKRLSSEVEKLREQMIRIEAQLSSQKQEVESEQK